MVPDGSTVVNTTNLEGTRSARAEHIFNPGASPSLATLELGQLDDAFDGLTVADLAKTLRVSRQTIRVWQDQGCRDRRGNLVQLPYFIVGSRRRYTNRREVAAFLAALNTRN